MKRNCLAVGCILATAVAMLFLVSPRASAQDAAQRRAAAIKSAEAVPTPRLADGHPDLSGVWGDLQGSGVLHKEADGTIQVLFPAREAPKGQDPDKKLTHDYEYIDANARREANKNKPPYKEELLAKVQELDDNENQVDPIITCHTAGVPRMGTPKQSFAIPGHVVFFYTGENSSHYRLIPTDGRPHRSDLQSSYMGDSVGHWEGDTLVVDVTGFNDNTWIGTGGWFHSTAMHVVERYTRQGNVLHYQATVEDPNIFTKPWVMDSRTVMLNTQPNNYVFEEFPCMDFDRTHFVNHNHF